MLALRASGAIALTILASIVACSSSEEEPVVEPRPIAADAGGDASPAPDPAPPADAGPDAPSTDVCSTTVGLAKPLPACSNETPCDRPAPELKGETLRISSTPPTCPAAMQLDTSDVAGFRRYACVSSPASATTTTKRPLVLWFHPGGEGADNVGETQLVTRAASYELGEPGDQGFHLAVVQGRNLRFPTRQPRDGRHHDFYHRDLASPSKNPDIAYADAIVDRLVATGTVDPKRIYVMGWSNGGFFGQLYAIARRNTATPGGSKVASAAVFATANPFDDVRWDPFANVARAGASSCRLAKVPASAVPVMLVYRTCDAAVAATPAQATCFDTEPGYVTEPWLAEAASAGLSYTALRLGGREPGTTLDQPATAATSPACTPTSCTPTVTTGCLCLVNHLIWPDGVYPNASSNIDHEVDMLEFLKSHPLP